MSDQLDGATDAGHPGAYPRTPGEFAARWNEWSEEHRAEWLRNAIRDTEIARRVRRTIINAE